MDGRLCDVEKPRRENHDHLSIRRTKFEWAGSKSNNGMFEIWKMKVCLRER